MSFLLLRTTKFALQNFFRNFWLSLATIIVIIITLLLVNIIISINELKGAVITSIENQINITLDFKQGIGEPAVLAIAETLDRDERVKQVTIVTPQENLEIFTIQRPQIGEQVLPVLDSNPFGYTLIVRAQRLEDYTQILAQFDDEQLDSTIDRKNFDDYQLLTSRAAIIVDRVNIGAVTLASIFLIIAVIIIFNTIRVSIYTHREEISIMKLVGASNQLIRWPFLLESTLYALVAIGMLALIIFTVLNLTQPLIDRYLSNLVSLDLLAYFTTHWFFLFGIQLAAVVVVNLISTFIALRKYLRV